VIEPRCYGPLAAPAAFTPDIESSLAFGRTTPFTPTARERANPVWMFGKNDRKTKRPPGFPWAASVRASALRNSPPQVSASGPETRSSF